MADAGSDLAALAAALGISRLATWGYSGGGPNALACAALAPDLVVAAVAVACPAPCDADGLDWTAGMGQSNVEEFARSREGEAAIRAAFKGEAASPPTSVEELVDGWADLLSPPDREVVERRLGS